MDKPAHLTKEYERDVGLVFEGLWARNLAFFIPKRLKIKPPYKPFTAFYVTGENLQIWENRDAIRWLRDCLLEENKKGTTFMEGVVSEYNWLMDPIKKYWEGGPITDVGKLKQYIKLVKDATLLFSLWYYAVSDARTPANVNELLVPLRTGDEFFGRNDVFMKDCVKLLGGDVALANLIFPDEFPNIPDEKILKERARGTVTVDGEHYITIPLTQFAQEHPEYFFEGLNDSFAEVKEFRGQAAFKGKVTGRVKIVKNKIQTQEVQEGDVLVSPMTTPDFLPAMQKAVAFVTDEGGIICHAAIVAREMKKPCIIGTKIATKVLKDGDMVEVDAEKGGCEEDFLVFLISI